MAGQDSSNPTRTKGFSCLQGCPVCPLGEAAEGLPGWRQAHAAAGAGELRAGRLVAVAAGVFVAPLAGGAIGALLAGEGEVRRFVGLVIGLVVSLVIAATIGRLTRGRPMEKEPV